MKLVAIFVLLSAFLLAMIFGAIVSLRGCPEIPNAKVYENGSLTQTFTIHRAPNGEILVCRDGRVIALIDQGEKSGSIPNDRFIYIFGLIIAQDAQPVGVSMNSIGKLGYDPQLTFMRNAVSFKYFQNEQIHQEILIDFGS